MTQFFKRHILMLTISELALAASLEDICKDIYCTKVNFSKFTTDSKKILVLRASEHISPAS